MWTNIPISIIILCALRYLSYEVELRWKVRPTYRQTYLSHLQKRQLSVNNPLLSTPPSASTWNKKINSPPVEFAIRGFIDKVLQDFVVDLWYSSITPDKEAPELIRVLILDAIGEISERIKEINLVDLLTRDMVELIDRHLDLFRRNQSTIGVEVMGTLSLEQRDERLKHHLMTSKELHPALISTECEYKVLQRLVGGVLAKALQPREAHCPLVRCFSRELLTCLVMQPVMNLASPANINELIEFLSLAPKDDRNTQVEKARDTSITGLHNHSVPHGNIQSSHLDSRNSASTLSNNMKLATSSRETSSIIHGNIAQGDTVNSIQPKPADWARVLDAATQRRTQVLAPENLENMWTKGRNYQKKAAKLSKSGASPGTTKMSSGIVDNYIQAKKGEEISASVPHNATATDDKCPLPSAYGSHSVAHLTGMELIKTNVSHDLDGMRPSEGGHSTYGRESQHSQLKENNKYQLKRSSSTSDLKKQKNTDSTFSHKAGEDVDTKNLYFPNSVKQKEDSSIRKTSEPVSLSEGSIQHPKLKCRVVGAYFEKMGSNSFAVYSIAVTDADNRTWFVKRRYRNFERLHRYLKDIPNYMLHLPPKRFLSSSIDDYFVHQRCIHLDKYLQDLLSVANIAEQHEVWDFLSESSKNYSFGKSASVMKTLAVNVDDAMDDIVRQFKGVSDGFRRKVVGSPQLTQSTSSPKIENSLSFMEEDSSKPIPSSNTETSHSMSEDDIHDEDNSTALASGWHSDNELDSKSFPPRVVKQSGGSRSFYSQISEPSESLVNALSNASFTSELLEDQTEVPSEWSPPNVSVPLLNLVDNIFQLKQRGWIRRQVFWISKQILQLMMEDAIDDWLLRQIHWLRKDNIIAQGICWVKDVLWPNGTFFMKLEGNQMNTVEDHDKKLASNASLMASDKIPSSFQQQLEASRRASDVKKIILSGAPTTLVSLIGHKQYQRCAKDIYYFLQSTICIKQLAYGMLELLLISLFPELHDLVRDIHQNPSTQPTSSEKRRS